MEFKGTKAPWSIEEVNVFYFEVIGDNEVVCEINSPHEDGKANAQLISCAPNMLEMLQYFVNENMLSITGEEMAIELIKKATEI
jgi:hypothetical protein